MNLVVDLAMALLLLEAAALALYRHRTGRGPAPAALAATWLAGAGLLLALRFALGPGSQLARPVDAHDFPVMAALALALAGHLADLVLRWPRTPAGRPQSRLPSSQRS